VKLGDVVTVAATGAYRKPRPAVIVQTDALPAEHASVVICQMTSECNDAPDFRVTIDPTARIGRQVGYLGQGYFAFECRFGICNGLSGLAAPAPDFAGPIVFETLSDTDKMARRNVLQLSCFLFLLMLSHRASADARQIALDKQLQENRYQLMVRNGTFGGPGAAFLKKELAAAQFVAIGEEHGTREVPQFVWATCRAMAADGLDALAIEAGPLVTSQLQLWTAKADGVMSLLAFEKRYPDSIAFFDWRQEFDLLSNCRQATVPHTLRLWGLDQEFLGSPKYILQLILDAQPGLPAESIVQQLQTQCAVDTQRGVASGSWQDACMLRLSQPDLVNLQTVLERTGNRRARELAAALIETHHIYSVHESGHSYDANRERALLLKHNFLTEYQQLAATIGKPPRVLLKFGENHLFKGFDETDLNDLGNFVTEFADGLGSTSLHIAVLGIRGEEEAKFGPGRADRAVAKDAAPGALRSFYAEAYRKSWTVFDLRPLRSEFACLGHIDRAVERLIFGYDTLVLIPEVTAQDAVQ
jgi:hypothetical protein